MVVMARTLAWDRTPDCLGGDEPFYTVAEYDSLTISSIVLVIIAFPMNIVIVNAYLTTLGYTHPKFLLRLPNKACLFLHVSSGIIEVILGIVMWFVPDPMPVTQVQAVISLVHVMTAIYQVPGLFGMKLFMNVGYGITILTKAYLAINVFVHPDCFQRALALTCCHTIYAWVRILWMFLVNYTNVMIDCQYTVAVILACLAAMPAIAIWMNAVLLICVALYYFALVLYNPPQWGYYLTEFTRSMRAFDTIKCPYLEAVAKGKTDLPSPTEEDKCRAAWNMINNNQNQNIDLDELSLLLTSFGLMESEVTATMKQYRSSSGGIEFQTFQKDFKPLWRWMYHWAGRDKISAKKMAHIEEKWDRHNATFSQREAEKNKAEAEKNKVSKLETGIGGSGAVPGEGF
jgi:hypothetical protein